MMFCVCFVLFGCWIFVEFEYELVQLRVLASRGRNGEE